MPGTMNRQSMQAKASNNLKKTVKFLPMYKYPITHFFHILANYSTIPIKGSAPHFRHRKNPDGEEVTNEAK